MYYYLQKTPMSVIKMYEEGQLSVKCVCTKVSKTQDSSSIQLNE